MYSKFHSTPEIYVKDMIEVPCNNCHWKQRRFELRFPPLLFSDGPICLVAVVMEGMPMGLCYFLYGAIFALLWIGGRAQYTACNGSSWIADGSCDSINNNIECGYDGGDCCECTCSRDRLYPCGFNGFDCLDPSVGNVTSECQNTISNSRLCSTQDTMQDWFVNDTASARTFAEAVNCTGGTFNVCLLYTSPSPRDS